MDKPHWMYHGCMSSAKLPSLRLCVCRIVHMPEQGCCTFDALIGCEQDLREGRMVRTNAPCFLWCPHKEKKARRKGAKRSHMFEALFFHVLPSQRQPRQCPSLLGWNIVCAQCKTGKAVLSRLETINQTRHHHTHVRKASNPKNGSSI